MNNAPWEVPTASLEEIKATLAYNLAHNLPTITYAVSGSSERLLQVHGEVGWYWVRLDADMQTLFEDLQHA